MAEALAIFGGIAAAVQLLDVAIKTSNDIGSFLRTARGAEHDVQTHLSIVEDVKTTLSLVSSWIVQRQSATDCGPIGGLDQLSDGLNLLSKELQELRDTLPTRKDINMRARLKWALQQKSFNTKMGNIERRLSYLKILLQVLSLNDQTSIHEKTGRIARASESLQTSLDDTQLASLAIQRTLVTTEEGSSRYHKAQMNVLRDLSEALPQHIEATRRDIDAQTNLLERMGSMMGLPPPTSSSSRPRYAQKTEHVVARVVREEMRKALKSIRQDLDKPELRNDTFEGHLHQVANDLTDQLLTQANPEDSANETQMTDHDRIQTLHLCTTEPTKESHPASIVQEPRKIPEKPWVWLSRSFLGNIRVTITPSQKWDPIRRTWTQHVTLDVKFWPVLPLLRQRCIALFYTTEPQRNSYYQLFPLIATYHIIPFQAPVLKCIETGDIDGLRQELLCGRANPNDHCFNGWTLLHCAAYYQNVDIIQLLLNLGADPSQTTIAGGTPVGTMIVCGWGFADFYLDYGQWTLAESFELLHLLFTEIDARDSDFFLFGSNVCENNMLASEMTKEWASFVHRQLPDFSKSVKIGSALWSPHNTCIVDFLLGLGMSPDDYVCHGTICGPPIMFVLSGFYFNERRLQFKRFHSENMVRLLKSGADIYIVCSLAGFFEDRDTLERTPTSYAIELGIEEFWKQALRQSGYNPLEVYAEDEGRRRKREIYKDAETTGLDYDTGLCSEQSLRFRGRGDRASEGC